MRPDEAKSAIAYDPALDEYCLMYPTEWTFKQAKTQPCQISLKFDIDYKNAEQFQNFLDSSRSNGDRIAKLWLKTAGLQLTTYELKECLGIKGQPAADHVVIDFYCLQY